MVIKYYVIKYLISTWNWFNVSYFFNKKSSGGDINKKIMQNKELEKPIIRKFEKRKVHLSFIDNIWGVDIADMQLISKFNKGFRFLL